MDTESVVPCLLLLAIVALIAAVVCGILSTSWKAFQEEQIRRQADEAEELERKRQQFLQATEKQRENERSLAIRSAVRDVREAAERHYVSTMPTDTLEQLEEFLKDNQLLFSRQGTYLTVRVAGTPTGWVGIEWILDPTLEGSIRITGRCDHSVVFREHAYRGLYTNVYHQGRQYFFSITAYDETYCITRDKVQFVVKIPSDEEWGRSLQHAPVAPALPAPEAVADAPTSREEWIRKKVQELVTIDELWEEAKREAQKRIEASDAPEPEKRRRRARLESHINQTRDQEEERG